MNQSHSYVPPPRRLRFLESLARRITWRTVLVVVALEGIGGISFVIAVSVIYIQLNGGTEAAAIMTAPPDTPATTATSVASAPDDPPASFDPGAVTYDATGLYAFPIAADPGQYVWTHYHWDTTHAADLEARADLSRAAFDQVTGAVLVAVTHGMAVNYSGSVGGQGYMLHGDDGYDYYYAHMSEQWVADSTRVTPGQPLGRIGSTGGTAQFIEPHLHFAIGPRDTLWESLPGVNAAEWIQAKFGLAWDERPAETIQPASPGGWPVRHPALAIVTPFDQAEARGLPQPALEFAFPDAPPDTALDVFATLSGEVNVIRWTDSYGTRIQINNDGTLSTVVISGVTEWLVQDGDVVEQGQKVGRWNPAIRPGLHYMIYVDGAIIDPTPTLGQ